ncbi:MAG TPA: hypothetical protein VIL43_04675 [Burkholderiales bacterium]
MGLLADSPPSLAEAVGRYKNTAAAVIEAYDLLDVPPAHQVSPRLLDAALRERMDAMQHLEADATAGDARTAARLVDEAIHLLMDLSAWAQRLGLDDIEPRFDELMLALADWAVSRGGEVHMIGPLADALAKRANREHDLAALERLTRLGTRIIRSTAPRARGASGPPHPDSPWRLLHLNCGIVATRTRNPALMEHVFEELVRNLPTEAPRFFAEGMQQLERLDFPLAARAVMARYFDRWTRPRMN